MGSLLKTAQGFAYEGDYAGAIQLLEDATKEDERFTKADRGLQEPVQGSCAQGGRGLCGKLRLRGRGGGARKIAGASFR